MSPPMALALFLALGSAIGPPVGDRWRDAPEYLTLAAPIGPRRSAYRTYVTTMDLETALARLAEDAEPLAPPGAWMPQSVLPADAFGQTGRYDRLKLARVYGSRRPRVARGPVGRDG